MTIKLTQTVELDYDLEYIRIDGNQIGTQVSANKQDQRPCKALSLTDLPQGAQDAYATFHAAVLDAALEGNKSCKDLLKIKDKKKHDEIYTQ